MGKCKKSKYDNFNKELQEAIKWPTWEKRVAEVVWVALNKIAELENRIEKLEKKENE